MTKMLGLCILMYHSIADNPRDPHAIRPEAFTRHISELTQQGYRVTSLAGALADLRRWRGISRSVVLTFDDAYKDFLHNAVPVLRHHKFHATVFAPTGLLGGTAIWDTHDTSKRLMDWDELVEVRRLGFDVGSHTVSHPRLHECDLPRLEREMRDSLAAIRERIGEAIPILSYPGGRFGQREVEAARRAGYVAAVGVTSRVANFPWTNRYRLRRQKWGQQLFPF